MTIEQLRKLVSHLPPGTEINISVRLGESDSPASVEAASPPESDRPGLEWPEPGWFKANGATKETVGISEAELRKAAKAEFVHSKVLKSTKSNGATLIEWNSFQRYLERRGLIKQLKEEPPEGWPGPGGGS